MDIKLDDNDIQYLILNIKRTSVSNKIISLKVNTYINYNFLYNSLVIFSNDLINIIYEYTQNQYVITYVLDHDKRFNRPTKIRFVNINNIFFNLEDTYELSFSKPSYVNITSFNYKLCNYHVKSNELLCDNDLLWSPTIPNNVVTVLTFVINRFIKIMVKKN